MSVLANANAIESGSGYTIANSLRLRASASASLSFTPGVAGDRKKLVRRFRIKRGALGNLQVIHSAGTASIDRFYFDSSDRLCLDVLGTARLVTTQVFRDPTAYSVDIGFELDVANGTAASRAKILVDGSEVSSYSTDGRASITNTDTNWNNTVVQYIGRDNAGNYFDGLISEPLGANGTTSVSSYSTANSDNVRVPTAPSATYGTAGWLLKFDNGTSTTTLGYDSSGNGNHWTLNNVSLTAGVTYDWMTDTPTNNYAAWAPINTYLNGTQYANLDILSTANNGNTRATMAFPKTGKWYFEVTRNETDSTTGFWWMVGAVKADTNNDVTAYTSSNFYLYNAGNGQKYNGSGSTYGASWNTNGDTISVAFDADTGAIYFAKNGQWADGAGNCNQTWSGAVAAFTGLTNAAGYYPVAHRTGGATSSAFSANFGQRPFSHSVPTGFKALATSNLPSVAITNPRKHFDVTTYAGNGTTGRVLSTNSQGSTFEFSPEFAWFKGRSASSTNHVLYDRLRGVQQYLITNSTNAESANTGSNGLTAFGTNSVTIGDDSSGSYNINGSGAPYGGTYVAWLWKANGSGVTNTSGTITSTVSANTTAGISVVTYSGNSTSTAVTIGHGLGRVPMFIITKNRTSARNWGVYHKYANASGDHLLYLDSTSAVTTGGSALYQGTTSPFTTDVFSVKGTTTGSNDVLNGASQTFVSYVFAEVPGFSKFGSYVGNGSATGDGPFVHLGFRARYVLLKDATTAATQWTIVDTARNTYNVSDARLIANLPNAENAQNLIDVTALGFKVRDPSSVINTNNATIIFAAFAEFPNGSNVAPAPAR